MNKLKITILSLSLITVMAGAATAPALGVIESYFDTASPLLIKLIVTLPPLFIIITSLFFSKISKHMSIKHLAILGLFFYIVGGCGAGLMSNIYLLLVFRALLGIGVGLIMPLSTGLISYYYEPSEQTKLMGYSSAMNNLGGVIAMTLSGFLVSVNWRYSFAVYLLGLLVMIFVVLFVPNEKLKNKEVSLSKKTIQKIYPYAILIFFVMIIFYVLPSNFSIIVIKEDLFSTALIGTIMSVQTLGSFLIGMKLSFAVNLFKTRTKYASAILIFLGFLILSLTSSIVFIAIGLFLLGIGLGIVVPLLNSQVAVKCDKEEVTLAMAIMSSLLYLGQFVSPLIIEILQNTLSISNIRFPFYTAAAMSIILLLGFKRVVIQK